MQATRSLVQRQHPLSEPKRQREVLDGHATGPDFHAALVAAGLAPLESSGIEVLQINVGKVCNQTCRHCHVDAGPDRRESMAPETIRACLDVIRQCRIPVVDITGGAPELHPNFRRLVSEARALGARVIDRCNLTILMAPGFEDLPGFLAEHQVEVVASLPCYLAENTDAQRGVGVFDRSIEALRALHAVGYGRVGSGLDLTLVHNPIGPKLPPDQSSLESAYRGELRARYGLEFTPLYTITNMPINRFLEDLLASGELDRYLEILVNAFNPMTVAGLMCLTTLSVGWDGRLHDCDFNQMLNLGLAPGRPRTIHDFDLEALSRRPIVTATHCFGCTAGSGSGCQGATITVASEPSPRPRLPETPRAKTIFDGQESR
jgi:radical SAM/Cys-rich protein